MKDLIRMIGDLNNHNEPLRLKVVCMFALKVEFRQQKINKQV